MIPVLVPVYQRASASAIIKSQSEASVWVSSAISSWYWTSLDRRPIRLIRSTLILDAKRNTFPFIIRRKARSSLDVDVLNRCPRSPWVRLLISWTLHRTFEMAPCDTPVILEISLWESPWPENRTITSIITGRISVSMHAILVWCGNLHTATVFSWMGLTQMRHTALEAIGKSAPPWKRPTGTARVLVDHGTLSKGRESSYIYSQWTSIKINIDFHQLWDKQ